MLYKLGHHNIDCTGFACLQQSCCVQNSQKQASVVLSCLIQTRLLLATMENSLGIQIQKESAAEKWQKGIRI